MPDIAKNRYGIEIGGFLKFSLIDYPGLLGAVVFTRGCNFRCPYCHNPELVLPEIYSDTLDPEEILAFLEKRIGKLESVTITGGEPTLHKGLIPFMEVVKGMGYRVKLDTNGTKPEVIGRIVEKNLADFIAMDIKAPRENYSRVSGVSVDLSAIEKSISTILNSGREYQFRTTLVPSMHTDRMRREIGEWMENLNAEHIFQDYVPGKTLDNFLLRPR